MEIKTNEHHREISPKNIFKKKSRKNALRVEFLASDRYHDQLTEKGKFFNGNSGSNKKAFYLERQHSIFNTTNSR